LDEDENELQMFPDIPYGAKIKIDDGAIVNKGERIVEWDPHHTPIIAEKKGYLMFEDIIFHVTMREETDPVTNITQLIISEHKEDRHPQIMIVNKDDEILSQYALPSGAIISRGFKEGDEVNEGMILARLPRTITKSRDITGGLPRVDELFEGRKPKDGAIITDVSGIYKFRGIAKGARKVSVITDNEEEHQYLIPVIRHIIVRDGDRVEAGEPLTDGAISTLM